MNSANSLAHESRDALLRSLAEASPQLSLRRLEALGLDTARGLTEILDNAEALTHHDPLVAERLAMLCDCAAAAMQLPALQARSRYHRAQIRAERGKLREALVLVGEAQQLWSDAGDELAALRTNLGRMHLLDDLGRHEEAVQLGLDMLSTLDARAVGGADRTTADQLRAHATENLGVAYGFTGQHTAALDAYASAENQYRSLGMHLEAGRPLASRGVEFLALGRPREAVVDLQNAHATFSAHGDSLYAAKCCGDLAQARRQLGEFAQALDLLDHASTALTDLGATVEAHRIRLALAETYLDAGLHSNARETAKEVAESTSEIGLAHDSAMATYVMALADLAQGRADRALELLATAELLFSHVNDQQFIVRTQFARSKAAAEVGAKEDARVLLDRCIPDLVEGGWLIPLAGAYLHHFDLNAADPPTAQSALDATEPLVAQLALPELTYQFRLRAGRLARREGRVAQAEEHLRAALLEADKLCETLPDHMVRIVFQAERREAHSELVDLLVDRMGPGDVLSAADIADAGKVRTLRDLLNQRSPRAPVASGTNSLARPAALRTELALPPPTAQTVRDTEPSPQSRLNSYVVAESAEPQPHPPTLAFHVADDDILVFVTVRHHTTCRRLSGALPLTHALLDALADQWSRVALGLGLDLSHQDSFLSSTQDTLAALYALLITPISDLIGSGPGPLCIVPDGAMGAVPFHTLFDADRYLLETWTVTMAPTQAAALVTVPTPVDCTSANVVVAVADEYAPAVRTEARLVAGVLPEAQLIMDDQATVEQVTTAIAAGVGVVHFACHGTHPPENPLFSRLRLSDRWLTSSEIVGHDLNGALVVLSACESGALGRSAEPFGLGWAFLAARASGVMASLWEVHDEATCTLATEVYRSLVQGTPPAEALRHAQLETAKRYPHPYYWAPFSFVTAPLVH